MTDHFRAPALVRSPRLVSVNVVAGQGAGGQVSLREQKHLAQVPALVPGVQVVHTSAVRSVLRTVAHAAAVGAVMCRYGDAGFGMTRAVHTCPHALEPGEDVRRVAFRARPTARAVR